MTKPHAAGAPIEFIAAGWASDPIIVVEENAVDGSVIAQNVVLWTIAHEAGHRVLELADVVDDTSIMHHQQSWTDYRLRYCPGERTTWQGPRTSGKRFHADQRWNECGEFCNRRKSEGGVLMEHGTRHCMKSKAGGIRSC
ncbi:MAG: hypothetical protein MZV70_47030 [Desulfobacterales bacterium]|nr:hypothetical protein [Desulfobacterales bacterium]